MSGNTNGSTLVSVLCLIATIAIGAYVFLQKPSSHVNKLDDRVSAVESRFLDSQGAEINLSEYAIWADSMSVWADSNSHARHVGQLWNWLKEGYIRCVGPDGPCDVEGSQPPDGGPCKPGQC